MALLVGTVVAGVLFALIYLLPYREAQAATGGRIPGFPGGILAAGGALSAIPLATNVGALLTFQDLTPGGPVGFVAEAFTACIGCVALLWFGRSRLDAAAARAKHRQIEDEEED